MIERIGAEALDEIVAYLQAHYLQAIYALSDLSLPREVLVRRRGLPEIIGYRSAEGIVGVQLFYPSGRWQAHVADVDAVPQMVEDTLARSVRSVFGGRPGLDPLLDAMTERGARLSLDETEQLCLLTGERFVPYTLPSVHRATPDDIPALAAMRCAFESEYFGVAPGWVAESWCQQVAAQYAEDGAWIAEEDGVTVAMAAVEARIPQTVHIGAVYTLPSHRGRGLAKGVVSAISAEHLKRWPRVSLTVRPANIPALRAYWSLGFLPAGLYRMCRIKLPG